MAGQVKPIPVSVILAAVNGDEGADLQHCDELQCTAGLKPAGQVSSPFPCPNGPEVKLHAL